MARITFNKNFSIGRVIAKLVSVTLALYVGNVMMNVLGSIMNGTQGPFNLGFKLLGWTVGAAPTNGTDGYYCTCASTPVCTSPVTTAVSDCITSYTGTGVLAVIGLVGIASIVMEFVEFRMG